MLAVFHQSYNILNYFEENAMKRKPKCYIWFLMMLFFFNRIGLERVGVIGLNLDSCCWVGLPTLDRRAGDRTAAGLICRLWV